MAARSDYTGDANEASGANNASGDASARKVSGDQALRELRVAIEHHARGVSDIDDLRAAVEQFCANARDENQPPERVLVMLKEALERLPAKALEPPSVQTRIKERIVSLAIQTYFGEPA